MYEGPFTVSESTTVKAKVFSDRCFDSQTVTARLTREWETVAAPVIGTASEFTGSKCKIVLSCATPGTAIRYTLDGREPNSHSKVYAAPLFVTDSCVVKAYAVKSDWLNSGTATQRITKRLGIGDTLGRPDHAFTTAGDAPFDRVADATAPLGVSMRSGEIGDSAAEGQWSRSVLATEVVGPGALSFKWKTSCEEDEEHNWDHAEFAVDGRVVAVLDGIGADWTEVTLRIEGDARHTLAWSYLKDDTESDGEDCLWVCAYDWLSDWTATRENATANVPYDWLLANWPDTVDEYESYERESKAVAANGINTVAEAFVAGLEPTDAESRFTVAIVPGEDGKFTLLPNPPPQEGRKYTVKGTDDLRKPEASWPEAELGDERFIETNRFFKVRVEML